MIRMVKRAARLWAALKARMAEELDDWRAGRRASAAYRAWQRDPSSGRPYEEVRAELAAEGRLDP